MLYDMSQEEIDALLAAAAGGGGDSGGGGSDAPPADDNGLSDILSDIEIDALGEIGNISMGSAATTLSTLLGHKVSITTPTVSVATMGTIQEHYPLPYIVVEVGYTVGINGNNVLAIQATDAAIIADLMMGGDGTNPDPNLSEIHMSAVGEAMNQMMGAVATSLSTMFGKKIDISPPIVNLVDFGNEEVVQEMMKNDEPIVRISFQMDVEGLIDSEIMQIVTVNVAKDMVESLMSTAMGPAPETTADVSASDITSSAPPPPPPPMSEQFPQQQQAQAPPPPPQQPQQQYAAPPPQQPYPQQPYPQQPYPQQPYPQQQYAPPPPGYGNNVVTNMPVSPAQFAPLSTAPVQVNDANIGLILDVLLQVTVELGRTKKTIKEILELSNGSIVELDKLAGEPVEIQVNGQFLAKGEVVVIEENFGVRITEIASPAERAAHLR